MNFRTTILALCMLLVPGLALCSHRFPPGTAATVRRLTWDPIAARLFSPRAAGQPVSGTPEGPAQPAPTQSAGAHDASRSPAAAGRDHPSLPLERLAELGATHVTTAPATTPPAGHLATCRVAVDPEGQLHRLFHAAGPDADAALRSLANEVAAWRDRVATGTDRSGPVADRPRSLRF